MSQNNTERRHHPRYFAPQLCVSLVSIASKAANNSQASPINQPIALTTLDFNHLGMSVESLEHFNVGDILHLRLSNGDTQAEEVRCFVCNRAKTEAGYRSGLHFLNDGENAQQNTFATPSSLLAIEQALECINK